MICKTELEYYSTEDLIYGFTDFGKEKGYPEIASCVLLMIRGLNFNCKQSIAYLIGKVIVNEFVETLKCTVEFLLDIG